MIGKQRTRRVIAAAALVVSLLLPAAVRALYLDEDQNFSLRARIYSQSAIRLVDSAAADLPPQEGPASAAERRDTLPSVRAGQLVQHRNFYNPELDAKLTPYTGWMKGTFLSWLAPDDLSFRIAGWGFYDGIYDYGTSQFDRAQRRINQDVGNFSRGVCSRDLRPCDSNADCAAGDTCQPSGGWFLEGQNLHEPANCVADSQRAGNCLVDSLQQLMPDFSVKDPRDVYASQQRVNELYFSYGKGPFFLRLGRQSISWGEADTIALLDQNNPFDITLAAPGLFQDLEEARIPLWTVRSSYNLFDTLGPFSSGFVEAYWVPGDIDTTTATLPILTASPYSPRGRDPQFSSGFPNSTYQFILFDHLPKKRFENSRYGFRVQTVINRAYTVQAWIYTHFPQAPVPRHVAPVVVKPGSAGVRTQAAVLCTRSFPQGCNPLFMVETVHDLTTVYGLATTFFVERVDGILRAEVELFENEPGFIPQYNLNLKTPEDEANGIGNPGFGSVTHPGTVPVADILRWELGFDRFFFIRPLNPTNSFVFVMSNVGAWNLDETPRKDFRANGQRKPLKDIISPTTAPVPNDFVQQKKVENFFQVTMQTEYLHGRLTPRLTYIQNLRGTYAFHPSLTYRWSDWLLFSADLIHIGGEYQSFGFFRDKDQLAFKVTYQLN
jgi:hypothetical protein